jgi:protoheme IX farnesyltransferase
VTLERPDVLKTSIGRSVRQIQWPAPADLVALARPRLAFLGLLMVAMSFFIAEPLKVDAGGFGALMVGSLLALCGASALNQVLERDIDGLMKRTADRPLPSGRVTPAAATAYGALLSLAGFAILAYANNGLTAGCALAGWLCYLFVYTPLKRRTSLCTVVGAVPGAVPVLMGWAAVTDRLGVDAWTLFAMLFLWQLPHFLAIAWMYRADYARAGLKMLPVEAPDGASTARQIVGYCLALVPVSLLPTLVGMASSVYFLGALILGLAYLWYGLHMGRQRTGLAARRLLRVSVIYLPLVFILLALDRALAL